VACKPDADLASALDHLLETGLLFRQGVPPQATYLFKHALVQDAAYGTLLREPRRSLHTRIADALESQFAGVADNQPELLARHYTEAGLTEKAATLWGKAGQRSLARSALVEAVEQFTRARDQLAKLPATPAVRREQIKVQVAVISPLIHVKGYAAPETKAALEKAKFLIEEAKKAGERLDDPLLLYTVLYGFVIANYVAVNGDALRSLASQFLSLAQKEAETGPLMIGHRVMGHALLLTGAVVESRAHYDEALKLYDPVKHAAATRLGGQDARVAVLVNRGRASWLLGCPEAARADAEYGVTYARESEHAATLMYALNLASYTYLQCGDWYSANALAAELAPLTEKKGAAMWKASALMTQGVLSLLSGKASEAVGMLTTGINGYRFTGATVFLPWLLTYLSTAYASLNQHYDASRCVTEAMEIVERTNERWCEAEVLRVAGEVTLVGLKQDAAKAQTLFERALAVARKQQAKSWELRASMSLARLWLDQDRPQQARELLSPVYQRFTEGFDTGDLKEAKKLLEVSFRKQQ
jgi:predicted ATPase